MRLKETSATDLNTRARMLFWGAAVEMWRAHPLAGVGADGYDGAYPQARAAFAARHPDSSLVSINERYLSSGAHNEYLQIMAELGAVGIALFLSFCAALVYAAWLALRRTTSPLAQGAVASLVAFEVHLVEPCERIAHVGLVVDRQPPPTAGIDVGEGAVDAEAVVDVDREGGDPGGLVEVVEVVHRGDARRRDRLHGRRLEWG